VAGGGVGHQSNAPTIRTPMSHPGDHPHTCSGLWLGRGGDETAVELVGSEQTDHVRLSRR